MASPRTPIPQVNLKDRIAALQQRNVSGSHSGGGGDSSSTHGSTSSRIALPGSSSLKDKIANFEKKGAVPIPRGRFGAAVPAPIDTSSKRRGELYGNRIPGLAKPAGDSVLSVRKRTVSSSDMSSVSQERATSPALSEASALSMDSAVTEDAKETLSPRLPSTVQAGGRRIVSDVLPRRKDEFEAEDSFNETEEETVEAAAGQDNVLPTPTIVVEFGITPAEPGSGEISAGFQVEVDIEEQVSAEPDTSEPIGEGELASPEPQLLVIAPEEHPMVSEEQISFPLVVEDDTLPVAPPPFPDEPIREQEQVEAAAIPVEPPVTCDGAEPPATDKKNDTIPLLPASEVTSIPGPTSPPPVDTQEPPAPDVDVLADEVPVSTLEASVLSVPPLDCEDLSARDDQSASSDSVPTPSDRISFRSSNSTEDPKLKTVDLGTDLAQESFATPDQSIIIDEPEVVTTVSPTEDVDSVSDERVPQVSGSVNVVGSQAALESQDVVPPAKLRARAYSASRPIPRIPKAPTIERTEESVLAYKEARKSFYAVVHDKVREPSSSEVIPPVPPLPPTVISSMANRIRSDSQPQSPALGSDLVTLMASAALLEEQLSGVSGPQRKRTTDPSHSLEPQHPVPEVREEQVEEELYHTPEQTSADLEEGAAFVTSPLLPSPAIVQPPPRSRSPESAMSHSFSMVSSDPPTPPRKSPSLFSGLRTRKKSLQMPGAFPRSSMCSEQSSEDSSMLISTPPTPPNGQRYAYDDRSETSSVRSSSKSWKSPKRMGLARASSWFFRRKGNDSAPEHLNTPEVPPLPPRAPSPSPSLLSPYGPPTARPPNPASPTERPTSWTSMTSTESFDTELFDAFPPVPGAIPSPPPTSAVPASGLNRAHTVAGHPSIHQHLRT